MAGDLLPFDRSFTFALACANATDNLDGRHAAVGIGKDFG